MKRVRLRALGLALAAMLLPTAGRSAGPADALLCTDPVAAVERRHGVEPGLLAAVAMVESGHRPAPGAPVRPWPWTVNADGQALYFDSRDEAIATVRTLMRQGMTTIDIGCMQISLHWHNAAFTTLEDIFDPAANVAYAARYLAELRDRHGSWEAAAGHYHSGDPARRASYLRKVMAAWKGDVRGVASVQDRDTDRSLARAVDAFAAGRLDVAAALYRDRLEKAPDDRAAYLGLAVALDRLGRPAEAVAAWKNLLARDADNARALARLIAHARTLAPAAALAEARALRRLAPRAAAPAALTGELLAAAGRPEEAVPALLRAVALEPGAAVHHLNAAITLDRLGRDRQALAHYRRFLDRQRGDSVALSVSAQDVRRRVAHLQRRLY